MKKAVLAKFMSVLLLSVVLLTPGVTLASDFAADMVINSPGEKGGKGKIYMLGRSIRMELGGAGEKAVTISRPDKKLVWILMPEEKMYMEQPYRDDPRMQEWSPAMEEKSKLVGNETVSGLACKKYQIEGQETYYWISEKIGFPVKTLHPQGSMVLSNIQVGSVSADLFEVPAGYQKFSMPAGAPGGMPQGFPGMPKGRK